MTSNWQMMNLGHQYQSFEYCNMLIISILQILTCDVTVTKMHRKSFERWLKSNDLWSVLNWSNIQTLDYSIVDYLQNRRFEHKMAPVSSLSAPVTRTEDGFWAVLRLTESGFETSLSVDFDGGKPKNERGGVGGGREIQRKIGPPHCNLAPG